MCAKVLVLLLSEGLPTPPETMLAAAATAAAAAASLCALACCALALISARVLAPVFLPPLTEVLEEIFDSSLGAG